MPSENFIYVESPQIPLSPVPYGDLKANITDPTTGNPYKGIVLEGIFAQLNDTPNNNNRVYDIPKYLELLEKLKEQIHGSKGVYGELEHPEKYSVDFNNVSHKILDVWWDATTKQVRGVILLLDTQKGKIAQEIIKSGGQLAISARAAGSEEQRPDGTMSAIVKMITTYDLVYHPGFSEAVLEFKTLNESQRFLQEKSLEKRGFGFKIYQSQLSKLSESYNMFTSLNESAESLNKKREYCFYEWFAIKNGLNNINESYNTKTKLNDPFKNIYNIYLDEITGVNRLNEETEQQKSDEKTMQENQASDEDEKEAELSNAVDNQLKEKSENFFQQMDEDLRKSKLGNAVYDGSAGFLIEKKKRKLR